MTLPAWHEEPLSKSHNRKSFDCGQNDLNAFLRHHARKSHVHGGAKTFVAVKSADRQSLLGFYSIAPACIAFDRTPLRVRRKLARHDVPVFRLARLAVDCSVQGNGLGGQLLLVAGRRCIWVASEVGGVALLIDAKSQSIATWYASYGAVPLLDQPLSLVLPLDTLQQALVAAGKM
ncbi:MAG: GNAT family N-acetyltransferase [Desulfovermiculus sp.]|nr:GNAT family N-acetyltransferase [Desulfovermiculus sp.]